MNFPVVYIRMRPKVTIGLCAKDAQKTIGFALTSVAKQDFDHQLIEIIFVNDGSTDNTLKIVKEFASKIDITTRVFDDGWQGIAKARNKVVFNAAGDYIIWLDSDETIETAFVRQQVQLMDKNPGAGIATAKLGLNSSDNLILQLDELPNIIGYYKKRKKPSKMPGTGGTVYRVVAIREIGGFDDTLQGACEDIEAASRMVNAGWSIVSGDSYFHESHGSMATLGNVWARSYKRGVDCRRLHNRTSVFFSPYRMNPVASIFMGTYYAILGFIETKKFITALLPFYYAFKMAAWFQGFFN